MASAPMVRLKCGYQVSGRGCRACGQSLHDICSENIGTVKFNLDLRLCVLLSTLSSSWSLHRHPPSSSSLSLSLSLPPFVFSPLISSFLHFSPCSLSLHPPARRLRSLGRDGQTSSHRPRLVVSRSTCPPLSTPPSPHANSLVIGTAVINTHRKRSWLRLRTLRGGSRRPPFWRTLI